MSTELTPEPAKDWQVAEKKDWLKRPGAAVTNDEVLSLIARIESDAKIITAHAEHQEKVKDLVEAAGIAERVLKSIDRSSESAWNHWLGEKDKCLYRLCEALAALQEQRA